MYQHPGKRPVFISLIKIRFPVNAWLSAGHRISGVMLFIALLGYLSLINLLLLNDSVTLDSIRTHWILLSLHTGFWIAMSFHWLTGLRHLMAEHFTAEKHYQRINSPQVSQLLLISWAFLSSAIFYQVWWL